MPKPKRIQRKRTKGWRMPEGAVYVGRPTKWGNPFKVGKAAWRFSTGVPYHHPETIEQVLANYRYYCEKWMWISPNWLKPLRGKDLACYCPLDQSCHADILLELANRPTP